MKRASVFLLALLTGCSPSAPPTPAVPSLEVKPAIVAAEPSPSEPQPVVKAEVAKPETPKVEPFRFLADTGGKLVERSVQPKPAPWEAAKPSRPISRDSELERGELPLVKPSLNAVPIPSSPRKEAIPPPPKEGISDRLGVGQELSLADRPLPVTSTAKSAPRPTPTAADVPRIATQLPERASLEDPTHEISTSRIVNTLMVAPIIAAPALRLLLPNPFEFADQVKTPAAPEFATSPVFVPAAKP
jgi:hypothetical protein